jgi:hypothetical protein
MGKLCLLLLIPILEACGSGCKAQPAINVQVAADGCLTAVAGPVGDTCGNTLPIVVVDNKCSKDWTDTKGIIAAAGQTGVKIQSDNPRVKLSGSLYQIIGTLAGMSAVVSFQIPTTTN